MMARHGVLEYMVLGTWDRLPASTYPGDAKEQLSTCRAGPPLGARRFREGGRGFIELMDDDGIASGIRYKYT